MIVRLTKDEFWPWYYESARGSNVEIPDQVWSEYHIAKARFEDAHQALELAIGDQDID